MVGWLAHALELARARFESEALRVPVAVRSCEACLFDVIPLNGTDARNLELLLALLAKVEQCRRLALGISDPKTAKLLLDLADQYVRQLKTARDG